MADVWVNSMSCHPRATCHIATNWRIQCHDPRAMCHIAVYWHWRIQRHVIPEPRITLQGAATWWIHCHDSRATCHVAGCNNFIRHIENRFSPYFILFLFFKCSLGFDERRLSYRLRYSCYLRVAVHWHRYYDARSSWLLADHVQVLCIAKRLGASSCRFTSLLRCG